MATAQDIINRSLRLIGVLGSGESPTGAEGVDALASLNAMLEVWRNDRLMVYSIDRVEFTSLVASTQTYTIGSGATINVERPLKIERASLLYRADTRS